MVLPGWSHIQHMKPSFPCRRLVGGPTRWGSALGLLLDVRRVRGRSILDARRKGSASVGRKISVGSVVGLMSSRPVLKPSARHPITIEPTGRHVTVRVNGEVV